MFSTPPPARRRTAAVALSVALSVALVAIVVAGTLTLTRGGSEDAPEVGGATSSSPSTSATAPEASASLADVDTTGLTVQRADFCGLVPAADVEAALGGVPGKAQTYGNGESAALTSEVTGIAAEHGCSWRRGRSVARGWVFAPPVTAADAERVIGAARRADGCAVRRSAPAYGSPTLARTCPAGEGYEVSYRGLFGDAWLTCSLTSPGARATALAAADTWCLAVAEAAAQPPA